MTLAHSLVNEQHSLDALPLLRPGLALAGVPQADECWHPLCVVGCVFSREYLNPRRAGSSANNASTAAGSEVRP